MVCAPERVTISWRVRFLEAKLLMSSVTLKFGRGRLARASLERETFPSRRPAGTRHVMLPAKAEASRAAKARMSAQETVLLQAASTADFAESITSKPWRLGLFGGESFSAVLLAVESIRTEPSQPWLLYA
ncbi:hypothetical protein QJS04_geneDACA015819 [Acorus gramineus]|uniref:Uncharacterized protein n=1 Tax=Acorus gramineus TaxID=55184 RepID=A0AAV9BM94_ACOGR|nr:hypothetical protein QJS04_geneDACA015819 [Acorus gramineus]